MTTLLWLNHGFSSLYNVIELLSLGVSRHGGFPGGLKVLLSHSNPGFVARPLADEFLDEPEDGHGEGYSDWCLDTCRARGVRIFWPSRQASSLAARAADFERAGVRLMVPAGPVTIETLNDKAAFYKACGGMGLGIPRYREANDLPAFRAAVEELRELGPAVCFKPARSIYGLGFKIIRSSHDPLASFLSGDSSSVSFQEALRVLDVPPERFPKLLVMEFLPPPEYSLDCLAMEGRLTAVTVRRKPLRSGAPESLADDPGLAEAAAALVGHFGLSWIVNVQFRSSPDGPKLLEINPRMAGGLYFSCLGGINYPYWAVRSALEDCGELVPGQKLGIRVSQAYRPFVYAADLPLEV
ncbi:MAG: ATP-grasp domain-containing protein [Deltaproteobacteria bacterium]|nr:ATP-grasp domain-containing protein [Deltaproteobacteria bacterium]